MNDIESSQPVALVSGASGGIGEAICRHLVEHGYRVVATGRNEARLRTLAQTLGNRLHPMLLDVTDSSAVKAVGGALPAQFSNPSVLVNNAGHDVGGRRLFEQGSADQWCDIIETNVQGMLRLTHALVDGMLARGSGHIVNMGSIAGLKPYATGSA
jgi:NADP-dependent 3-hydroxy acid dehydrogenase YdfG